MKTRILSAVVALPLLLFIVISGGIWLHVGVGLLGLIGMYEFNRAIAGEVKGAHIIAYLFGLFYVVFMDKLVYTQTLFSVFTSLFVLALLIYSVLCYRKTSYVECCASFFGFFYDELVDAVLRERMVSGDLADVNAFRVGPGIAEQGVVGEVVVHDHISLFENVLALDGQQTGVAGSGADEIDFHAILVVFLSHPGVIPRVREAGLMNTCLVKAERPCLGACPSRGGMMPQEENPRADKGIGKRR